MEGIPVPVVQSSVSTGPALSEADIAAFERALLAELPPNYRHFLLRQNGGTPKPRLIPVAGGPESEVEVVTLLALLGLPAFDLRCARTDYADRIPPEYLVVGFCGGAELLVLVLVGASIGEVLLWDPYVDGVYAWGEEGFFGAYYHIASNFDEFLAL